MAPFPLSNGWQLALPKSVRFGWGVRRELPRVALGLGRRAWLIFGSRMLMGSGLLEELRRELATQGIESDLLTTISREPLVEDVDDTLSRLREAGVRDGDVVLAIGGGAAIDLGKAVAALATNRQGGSVLDFLEGVGRGLTIDIPPLPMIAVPTTAGTGSEATRNAVISSRAPRFKKSLRSEQLVPTAVVIDPELTTSCPRLVTAHSGMDAITQLIESLLTRRSNAFTSALCLEGLQHALPALPRAVADGRDREAREAMAYAAFLSGVALANSGLGLAHGVAAALGVHCDIPHGLACAVMLPTAMRYNREVRPRRLAEIGRLLSQSHDCVLADGDTEATAADAAITGIESLNRVLGIPSSLRELDVRPDRIDALVTASQGNSLSGNPRDVSDEELRTMLVSLCR